MGTPLDKRSDRERRDYLGKISAQSPQLARLLDALKELQDGRNATIPSSELLEVLSDNEVRKHRPEIQVLAMNLLGECQDNNDGSAEFVRAITLGSETIPDLRIAGLKTLVKWIGKDASSTLQEIWTSQPNRNPASVRSTAILALGYVGVGTYCEEVVRLLEEALKLGVRNRRRTDIGALIGYLAAISLYDEAVSARLKSVVRPFVASCDPQFRREIVAFYPGIDDPSLTDEDLPLSGKSVEDMFRQFRRGSYFDGPSGFSMSH